DWAKLEFGWFEAHFMNQPGGPLIRDGLNDADNCSLTGDPITYFQGVILGGLLDMATAEREWPTHTDHNAQTYIDEATTIADAVTTQLTTNDAFCPTCGAILTEPAFGDCSNSPD